MADFRQNLALALQGFGAGVGGRGPQFLAQQQKLSDERRQALLVDNRNALGLLGQGKHDLAAQLLRDRVEKINQLGGDPSDTQEQLIRIESGDITGAIDQGRLLDNTAVQRGFLKAAPVSKFISQKGNQVIVRTPGGKFVAQPIEGLSPSTEITKLNKIEDGQAFVEIQDAAGNVTGVRAIPIKDYIDQVGVLEMKDLRPINKEVGNLVQGAVDIRNSASSLTKLAETKSPTDKLAAIFKFMKALDPRSVVREGEQQQAVATGGAVDVMIGFINQIKGTGTLSAKAFNNMVTTSQNLANQAIADSRGTVNSYLLGFGDMLPQKRKTDLLRRIPESFQDIRPPSSIDVEAPVPTSGIKILSVTPAR